MPTGRWGYPTSHARAHTRTVAFYQSALTLPRMTQTSRAVKAEAELAAMTLGAVAGPSLARDTPDDMAALAVGLYVGVFVSRSLFAPPQPAEL